MTVKFFKEIDLESIIKGIDNLEQRFEQEHSDTARSLYNMQKEFQKKIKAATSKLESNSSFKNVDVNQISY